MNDHLLAADLATRAGQLLLRVRDELAGAETGELRSEGDRRSHELLARALSDARPEDALLSEEAPDPDARHTAERVWIVDPLDGTREYSEGRSDWAVHVALWQAGDLVAGAVALPGESLLFSTADPPVVPSRETGPIRLVVSRSRPPAFLDELARALGAQTLPLGSAGAKAMAVVRGHVDAYVHAGGQYQWDSAAPVAVARAAGLHTSRVDGSPLSYNGADARLPDVLICRPEIRDQLLPVARDLHAREAASAS